MVAIVRLANRDGEVSCSWSPDGLEVRALVASSYHDHDTILNEIVDFTTDGISPVRGKIRCNREVQDLHAKLSETLTCVDDLMHIPVRAYAVLRNYHIRTRSDTSDQPNDAGFMTDRVTDVRAYKAERIDSAVREVRMREIDPGADNADPNMFP